MKNIAFVDGQNLYMGTAKRETDPWVIDLKRFRIYLAEKYSVTTAYYHLGYVQDTGKAHDLYDKIQNAGFIVVFKKHLERMVGNKKGNVDSDIIFYVMRKLYKKENFDKIVLVSGDGDYHLLVEFLIKEKRFKKILFPNKKFASSLYRGMGSEFYDYLDNLRTYIGRK
jgi:uncharacterized LabA/DUF88 family protein